MTTYKYTDATNQVVSIIDDDGVSRNSCIASALPIGTVILAADPPPPPSQDELNASAAKNNVKLTALKVMTPAQVQTWCDANITNLAAAKDAITTLAIAVSILAKKI